MIVFRQRHPSLGLLLDTCLSCTHLRMVHESARVFMLLTVGAAEFLPSASFTHDRHISALEPNEFGFPFLELFDFTVFTWSYVEFGEVQRQPPLPWPNAESLIPVVRMTILTVHLHRG
jgi:hypothetical protein